MGGWETTSQNGSLPFRTGELECMIVGYCEAGLLLNHRILLMKLILLAESEYAINKKYRCFALNVAKFIILTSYF